MRYFKRPDAFRSLLFLEYFQPMKFHNPRNVPARIRTVNAHMFMENASQISCVAERQEMDEDESIARIRFVRPSTGALFALRHILLERPMSYFRRVMYWEGTRYNTWRDTTIAVGFNPTAYKLYEDG